MKIIDDGKVLHIIEEEEDKENDFSDDEVILRDHREGDPDPLDEIRKTLKAKCAAENKDIEETK